MFVPLSSLLLLSIVWKFSDSQFLDAEINSPWQFAGFAALNIPDNEGSSSYIPSYSPFQQQYSLNRRFEQRQQSLISSPYNFPFLPSAIPKREIGNSLKIESGDHDKEKQQGEVPEFSISGTTLEHATYLSLINDKENFQASGCGWDLIRLQCYDFFGLCKGGCRDFSIAVNSPYMIADAFHLATWRC